MDNQLNPLFFIPQQRTNNPTPNIWQPIGVTDYNPQINNYNSNIHRNNDLLNQLSAISNNTQNNQDNLQNRFQDIIQKQNNIIQQNNDKYPDSIPTPLLSSQQQNDFTLKSPTLANALAFKEGANDPNTLFGHLEKTHFTDKPISNMTLQEVINFTNPQGPYGQMVKSKIGRISTPTGYAQLVGSTIKDLTQTLNLNPNMLYNAKTQAILTDALAHKTIGNYPMDIARQNLRNTWVGLKNIPDMELNRIIYDYRTGSS